MSSVNCPERHHLICLYKISILQNYAYSYLFIIFAYEVLMKIKSKKDLIFRLKEDGKNFLTKLKCCKLFNFNSGFRNRRYNMFLEFQES